MLLCRYTTLVERYFTYICKCFNSKHENVRMTALMSVMKRVKEEYVKLRPFILFPMLTMILDASVSIKRTIATFISVDLKKKNNILETFYTGLFYFLNNCKVSWIFQIKLMRKFIDPSSFSTRVLIIWVFLIFSPNLNYSVRLVDIFLE